MIIHYYRIEDRYIYEQDGIIEHNDLSKGIFNTYTKYIVSNKWLNIPLDSITDYLHVEV